MKERQLCMRFERKKERGGLHDIALTQVGNSVRHPLLAFPVANMLNNRIRKDDIKVSPLEWQLTGIAPDKAEPLLITMIRTTQVKQRYMVAIR